MRGCLWIQSESLSFKNKISSIAFIVMEDIFNIHFVILFVLHLLFIAYLERISH